MANFESITIAAVGLQVTTGAASAVAAIPLNQNGTKPKYVRLQAITAVCYIKPGLAAAVATINDAPLSPNEALILNVAGFSHIAHIQSTAAEKFNITPLEDV
jgi:hypothetical protein